MPPVSSIKRLPPALRAAIAEQLEAGRTLDEVTAHVRGMGAEVSRSAIGRHKVQLDKILERSRHTREIAEVLAHSVGHGGDGIIIQGNAELLHGILMRAANDVDSGEIMDTKDAMQLAIALEKLARASKTGAELEKLRAEAATAIVDTEVTAPSKQIEVIFIEPEKKQDA